jgi:hypothetical protein
MAVPPTVSIHARIAVVTRDLARVCAANKGMSDSAFYRLAIEEAVNKYRPKHKIAEEGTEDIREALLADLDRMELLE